MSSDLAQAVAWQAEQLRDVAMEPITYKRGAASVSIYAIVGITKGLADPSKGNLIVERPGKNFWIIAADLNFGSGIVKPVAGDIIQEADGDQYRVMPPQGGIHESATVADAFGLRIRCHAKFIGTV